MNPRFRSKSVSLLRSASLGLALASGSSPAKTVDITVRGFEFSPATVTIEPGDSVRWVWSNGSHTVTSGANCTADNRFNFAADGVNGTGGTQTFTSAGTFPFFCRPHCTAGMKGQVVVAEAAKPTPAPLVATKLDNPVAASVRQGPITVKLQQIVKGLTAPNYGTTAPGDTSRLFVTDQVGKLWAIDLNTQQKSLFADLKSLLVPVGFLGDYDERGLLGVAFHPNYQSNGLVYTFTSEPVGTDPADFTTIRTKKKADHQSVIREWRVPTPGASQSVVDPASTRVVLRIDKPQFNHNGGTLAFGPDGYLYISLGDGGNADDQGFGHISGGNAQSLANVLGKILRIDPTARTAPNLQYGVPSDNPFVSADTNRGGQAGCADGQCDEIYAYGLRNPYRFSFDSGSLHTLFAADVGQNSVEEVDIVRAGGNYGWRKREGRFCFNPNGANPGFVTAPVNCISEGLIGPIAQYDHDEGSAIIGGFVYRGSLLPQLSGSYVFGDYSRTFNADGRLFYLRRTDLAPDTTSNSPIAALKVRGRSQLGIAVLGFGQDAAGEIYVLGNRTGGTKRKTGAVWKISN